MAERNPPVWLQAGSYSAEADRMVTGLLVDRNVTSSGALTSLQSGVVPPSDQLRVLEPTSNTMTLNVSPGMAAIAKNSINPPGIYLCYNDNTDTVTFDPAASAPRNDLVVARVYDSEQGDTGPNTNQWFIEVVKGIEGSLNDPTLPQTSIPLARVKVVPAINNGNVNKINPADITDLRNFVTGFGGVNIVWPGTPHPVGSPGRMKYVVSEKTMYIYNGTAWDTLMSKTLLNDDLKKYRPAQMYWVGEVYTVHRDTWTGGTNSAANNVQVGELLTPAFSTPSGMVKVTVQAYGKVTHTNMIGHLSVAIRDMNNNNLIGGPTASNFGWGPSFYSTTWSTSSMTTVFAGLPPNTPLVALTAFRGEASGDATGRRGHFARIRLIVEPVLGSA